MRVGVCICCVRVRHSANLLGVAPLGRRSATPARRDSDEFELLGIKWLSNISVAVAKELTPYEVGDRNWRPSVRALSSGTIFFLFFNFKLIYKVVTSESLDSVRERLVQGRT